MPIHDLMATNGVTIFFQGHDHIFCRQELDGVIYQTLPEPGDPNYALHNADAFQSDVKFPNTGYTRVTVSPDEVQVDYVRTYLPEDETPEHPSGEVAYSYTVPLVAGPPVIAEVTRRPAQPTEESDVWVTATVTDNVAVAAVTLAYEVGSNVDATVFHETMRTAQVKPWAGDGCDHAWTVTASAANHIEQRTNANYGGENGDRVRVDQISVTTRSGGAAASVAMHDDGAHYDGEAKDNMYGASIPAQPTGTSVSYHIAVTDSDGLVTTAPPGAPIERNTYTVQPPLPLQITEVALDYEESRLRFTWHSVPGRAYELQMATTLRPPDFAQPDQDLVPMKSLLGCPKGGVGSVLIPMTHLLRGQPLPASSV